MILSVVTFYFRLLSIIPFKKRKPKFWGSPFGVVVHWWLIFHAFDWNTEILLPMTKSENLVEVISWKLIPVAVESPQLDD